MKIIIFNKDRYTALKISAGLPAQNLKVKPNNSIAPSLPIRVDQAVDAYTTREPPATPTQEGA